jgi:hypothetical protein
MQAPALIYGRSESQAGQRTPIEQVLEGRSQGRSGIERNHRDNYESESNVTDLSDPHSEKQKSRITSTEEGI